MLEQVKTLQPLVSRVWTGKTAKKTNGKTFWTGSDPEANPVEPLTEYRIRRHLNGGPGRGCGWISPGTNTSLGATIDLDSHKGETDWAGMAAAADKILGIAPEFGITLHPFSSSGGRGIHLYAIWDAPQDAYSLRQQLRDMIGAAGFIDKAGGRGVADGFAEIFPKQDSVPEDGSGNYFILPLHAKSVPLDSDTLAPLPVDTPVAWRCSEPVPVRTKPIPEPRERGDTPADLVEIRGALMHIASKIRYEIGREEWRNLIFGLHYEAEGSDEGLALADEFSSRCREYDADEVVKLWESSREKDASITGATIRFRARELGWNPTTADDFTDETPTDVTPDGKPRRDPYGVMLRDEFLATLEPTVWWIRGVLPAARTVMTYGASKSGKTFMVLDMAVALDQGTPWRGRKTKKLRVCYVCAEGYNGFVRRMQAYEKHYKIKLGIGVIRHSPDLMKLGNAEKLGEALIASGGWDVVIVDTMARVMAGADENSGDAGKLIHNVETALQHASPTGGQAMAWFIHHSGKDESKGSRGWSGVPAAMDTEFRVTRDEDVRTMEITKQKDGEEGDKFGFKLRMVPLGIFEPADPDDPTDCPTEISSCVVEHTDEVVDTGKAPAKGGGARQKQLLKILADMTDLGGVGVDLEELCAAASKATDGNVAVKSFRESARVMLDRGILRAEDNKVVLA